MGFESFLGQPTARQTLERALESGRVHHAYRFEGPAGVGKSTLAKLVARALLCPVEPFGCGRCSSCERALSVSEDAPHVPKHPDLLYVGRGIYPASLIGAAEATGVSVEQIRRIVQPRVGYPPHEGRALVILIFDADELSVSAANALLKTLEEPADRTHFLLLTSRPGRLLDTIRSRTLAVRFGPLPEKVVAELLAREGLDEGLAPLAEGSLARARLLGDPELRERNEAFVEAALRAMREPHPAAALRFADERPEGRDDLLLSLAYLGATCATRARRTDTAHARLWAERYHTVLTAQRRIEQNGSPALVLETMLLELRATGS